MAEYANSAVVAGLHPEPHTGLPGRAGGREAEKQEGRDSLLLNGTSGFYGMQCDEEDHKGKEIVEQISNT